MKSTDIEDIRTVFPDLEDNLLSDLVGTLSGYVVGRDICHVWYETDKKLKTVYSGRLEKLRKRKGNYKVAYWGEGQCYDDAEDYKVSKFQLGANLICGDLGAVLALTSVTVKSVCDINFRLLLRSLHIRKYCMDTSVGEKVARNGF